MTARETGERLEDEQFDRVMLKSANHEIPRERQQELYHSVFRVLKPGGLFVNLGMLFDDHVERDEFRAIARAKDTMAQMYDAVANRHFLVRDEFYEYLDHCGYVDCRAARTFNYEIWSDVVRGQYFDRFEDRALEYDLEHQAAQVRAHTLRRKGRIKFEGDRSAMFCPGEITVARKPTRRAPVSSIYRKYPYDFVKRFSVYRELMNLVAVHVAPRSRHLDLGCGNGFLAEKLIPKDVRYTGYDISEEFVRCCLERYGHIRRYTFDVADINRLSLSHSAFDSVSLINVLYHSGIDAAAIIRGVHRTLKDGGRIIVSGPISRESFARAWPKMLAQLQREGLADGNAEELASIEAANAKLLADDANYWSVEGVIALLQAAGFKKVLRADSTLYYGNSYLVVAEK